ncbi:2x WD domain containing [Cryptosporidium sp. chipmunk genotype I]|uniref:2x WD domain containing n=1 Tax=Cryptosporidium sp. chipmunk genotype I TaxID=1280935 RepID=UPI00351A33C5|nr:2x WD domain containing [Cryptosporidium sp. chipmunk genotype I]
MTFTRTPVLLEMPKEIILGVCYFLEPKDTINLSLTCNSAYLTIHNNPIIWRFYCHKFGFVQNKKGKKWCLEKVHQIPGNKRDDMNEYCSERKRVIRMSKLNSKRNTHMPKEEVQAYSIEFGDDDDFLKILEYNWWNENHSKIVINQGKKPILELDNSELENIRLDISLATELVNWRLVFYMNILNEDPNNIFWLRIGTDIDIMTPITSVKIDPKIYQDMEDTVINRIFDFAKKIKYLSTLHTCRHFIRLPCPIRIREILIGGRIGNIISSEPSSHGRYLLELPKELVHMVNLNDISNPKCDDDNFLGNKKLQLPINIHRKLFLDNSTKGRARTIMEGKDVRILEEEEKGDKEYREGSGIMYKIASSSIEFVTIASAFISYANSPNWTTSLTPKSISAFKQMGIPTNEGFQLFSELLNQMHKGQKGVKGEIRFGAVNDYYSNMNLTHSPVNCTTPCSVINRTCNLEFQNIRQYFKMLCSNSIIFNMFATSINLQDSAFENDQCYSCWCEYPKSLLGCTWCYNPNRSNLQDIKNFNSGLFSSLHNSSLENTNSLRGIGSKANLELTLDIIQNHQGLERHFNRRYISLNREEMCLADLIYSIKASLDGVINDSVKDDRSYNIFILRGIGWRKLNDHENEENEDVTETLLLEKEMEKRVYGENLTRNEKILSKLKDYSGDLLSSLMKNFFFVNGEKIKVEIKQIGAEEIFEDLKEQYKIHKEFVMPISWSSDGLTLSKISFLPIRIEEKHDFGLKSNIDGSSGSEEYQFGVQRSFSGISNMSTMPSFSSFSSLESHMLNSAARFSKCKIITLYREPNRFKDHKDYSGDILVRNPESKHDFCLKSLIKNTNEIYKDLIAGKFYGDNNSRFSSFNSHTIHNTLYFGCNSNSENVRVDQNFKEDFLIKNQYKFTLLQSSQDTRQFEFHSDRSDLILIGTSLGKVKLIDRYNDVVLAEQGISLSPIIGLSWFNNHPQTFVAGSCLLGTISILSYKENPFYQPTDYFQDQDNSYQSHRKVDQDKQDDKFPYLFNTESKSKSFPQLSSLSVNATDDYYLASGFGKSVGLYNTHTGSQVKILPSMHMSHINIVRFANYHPHIFSTASFDSSCKLWDLRQKINGNDPIIKFELPCMAIMSCFSPKDDFKMVVSGVDDYLKQLDLRSKETNYGNEGRNFAIPPLRDSQSYRRSVYNSNGDFVLSINTKDKYVRIFDSESLSPEFKFGYFQILNAHYEEVPQKKFSDCSFSVVHTFTESAVNRNEVIHSNLHTEREILEAIDSRSSAQMAEMEGARVTEVEDDIRIHQYINNEENESGSEKKDYSLLSVRGHPIYADIGGFLISESTGNSKLALLKFGKVFKG